MLDYFDLDFNDASCGQSRRRKFVVGVLLTLALGAAIVLGSPADAASPTPLDYDDSANWLCRPDAMRYCDTDLSSTIVLADGSLSVAPFQSSPDVPVDCFYLYPTTSQDPGSVSDTTPGEDEEIRAVRQQFALFASVCRLFAPVYRQIPVSAAFSLGDSQREFDVPAADILAAWHHYVERDNQGRGVVLIGHSQGAGWLRELLRSEIDGKPIQDRVLSAMLLGAVVSVAKGQDVGGDFQHMPLCREAGQIGCIITFASFRSTVPADADSGFGTLRSYVTTGNLMTGNGRELEARISSAEFDIGCTNPAALAGGSGLLDAYLTASSDYGLGLKPQPPWAVGAPLISTLFVRVPGLLSSECVDNEHARYLEITVQDDPWDPRTNDIGGDFLTAEGRPSARYGLHAIDVNSRWGI